MKTLKPNSMRAAWGPAAWGALLGLSLALLVWAPAQWLAWGVSQASQGQVQWLDARGTVWAGSAHWVLSGGTGSRSQQALPGRLHWTLLPTWTGLRLRWLADCCMTEAASLQVQAGLSSLQLQASDSSTQWPAAFLTGLGSPWNTLQLDGQLRLRTEALKLNWTQGRLQIKGLAELQVKNLSSSLSSIKPIGSYQLQLRGPAKGTATPSLQLNTLEGPLHLTGQSQWMGFRLRFTGEASAQEGHEAGLANLLNILGHRQGARSLFSFEATP